MYLYVLMQILAHSDVLCLCGCAQLNGPIEVIHLARVREDCQGGKNDLSVQQGENVEIIRVNNNPGGKWLARDARGSSTSLFVHKLL